MTPYIVDSFTAGLDSYTLDPQAAQTFLATGGYRLVQVSLYLKKANSTQGGIVRVDLYSVDVAHKPNVLLVALGTINATTEPVGTRWHDLSIDAYDLTAGVEYAIVATPSQANTFGWMDENAASYTNGVGYTKVGIDWVEWCDFDFRCYAGFSPPSSGPTKKRLIAAANNKIWYETTT